MTVLSRRSVSCLVLLLVPFLAGRAQGPAKGKEKEKDKRAVRVCVLAILASETDETVEKKLAEVAKEVRKMHPKLKGFRMEKLGTRSMPIGTSEKFELVEDQTTKVTIQRAADKMDRVRLKVAPPMMGEITYSTPCGKFLPVVTPFRTKSNELLIIAIRVEPCNGK